MQEEAIEEGCVLIVLHRNGSSSLGHLPRPGFPMIESQCAPLTLRQV